MFNLNLYHEAIYKVTLEVAVNPNCAVALLALTTPPHPEE